MSQNSLFQQLESLGFSEDTYGKINGIAGDLYDFVRCQRPSGKVYGARFKCRPPAVEIEAKEEVPKVGRKAKTKVEPPKEGAGPEKTRGIRIGKGVQKMDEASLEKLLKDPRVKPHQADKIRSILEGRKGSKSSAETPAKAKPKPQEAAPRAKAPEADATPASKPKPKPKAQEPAKEKAEATPSTGQASKVTNERLKKSFERTIAKGEELLAQEKELKKRGLKYDHPEAQALYSRIRANRDAVETMRQAYHAVDRDEFIRASAQRSKLMRSSERMLMDANARIKAAGLSPYSMPETHPLMKKREEADERRVQANGEPLERQQAAYFGEPIKAGKLKSDGGGNVDPSVPGGLPRGGS